MLLWLLGRGAPRIVDAAWTGIGPSIGWGLLAFFGLPILGIIALVTLVGIPLGLGVLAALGLIYALGYAATAWIVGRRIVREPTAWILAFLAGWGILRVLALVPVLGGLVGWAAAVLGLGALIVAIWRARTTSQGRPGNRLTCLSWVLGRKSMRIHGSAGPVGSSLGGGVWAMGRMRTTRRRGGSDDCPP